MDRGFLSLSGEEEKKSFLFGGPMPYGPAVVILRRETARWDAFRARTNHQTNEDRLAGADGAGDTAATAAAAAAAASAAAAGRGMERSPQARLLLFGSRQQCTANAREKICLSEQATQTTRPMLYLGGIGVRRHVL